MHWKTTLAAVVLACNATVATAETMGDGKALLGAAVAELKTKGPDAAIQEFNSGGKWVKGNMYVVMADFTGVMLVHSANQKIVGKNMFEVKDATGRLFVQEAIKAAQSGAGETAIPLRWMNPTTKKIDSGHIIVTRASGKDAYVGAVYFE
ncbi:cache domain-containing protein [Aquabacterium sp. J223]|uniref:cache domain-containing protein n=1 Tax=Aquabacterium sp. J223 TaxID=2898431 RepID=UPI0021AD88CC|nr:cache domain-containing protein [Aquabacterium sp. J223]UUX97757.1 cache domain-containing protein [Aquabacterium sp. J223]